MRAWINLVEQQIPKSPAEQFVSAVESAMQQFGDHVDLTLFQKGDKVAEIHEISAEPMGQGWGTKAMTVICGLADQYGVVLVLEVANDDDGDSDYDDDDEEDDGYEDYDADDNDEDELSLPSEDDLVSWYSGFGFVEREALSSRRQMVRKPASRAE